MQEFHRKPADQDNGFLEEGGLCFLISGISFWASVSSNFEHMFLTEYCYHIKKKNRFVYTFSLCDRILELQVVFKQQKKEFERICKKRYCWALNLGT